MRSPTLAPADTVMRRPSAGFWCTNPQSVRIRKRRSASLRCESLSVGTLSRPSSLADLSSAALIVPSKKSPPGSSAPIASGWERLLTAVRNQMDSLATERARLAASLRDLQDRRDSRTGAIALADPAYVPLADGLIQRGGMLDDLAAGSPWLAVRIWSVWLALMVLDLSAMVATLMVTPPLTYCLREVAALDGLHRELRGERLHEGQAGEAVDVEHLEGGWPGRDDPQQVVGLAHHPQDLDHIGDVGDGLIEHDLAITFGERGQARGEFGLSHGAPEPAVGGFVRLGHGVGLPPIWVSRKWDPGFHFACSTHWSKRF